MSAGTMRARFLAAAAEIAEVYRDTSGPIGYDGRKRVQAAYTRLHELSTWIPDTAEGWLPYGDVSAKDLAQARRRAEDGWASPQVTLQLISQVLSLRQQLAALGGTYGVTDDDIRSALSEGFHTAFRKASVHPLAAAIYSLIEDLPPDDWSAILDFTVGPLIAMLREAENRTADSAEPVPEHTARLLALAAVLEQADGRQYTLSEVSDRAVRVLLEQLAGDGQAEAGCRAFRQYYRNADQEPPDWDAQDPAVQFSWINIARAAAGSGKDTAS